MSRGDACGVVLLEENSLICTCTGDFRFAGQLTRGHDLVCGALDMFELVRLASRFHHRASWHGLVDLTLTINRDTVVFTLVESSRVAVMNHRSAELVTVVEVRPLSCVCVCRLSLCGGRSMPQVEVAEVTKVVYYPKLIRLVELGFSVDCNVSMLSANLLPYTIFVHGHDATINAYEQVG